MSAAAPTVRRIDRKPGKLVPVLVVTLAILAIWYAGAYWMNRSLALDVFARQKVVPTTEQLVDATWSMERPLLPAPHQIAVEVWKTTADQKITSKRSLVYHAWVTLSATLAGFVSGTLLGILLAIGIVHVASLEKSLMPWIIASQTIPIVAIAPMIVVVGYNLLNGQLGVSTDASRFIAKAMISTYLSFFPITVGLVKGFRSPEIMHLDLMRTYSASRAQTFWKLRLPAAMPYLFTSMQVAIAISLVGAIVGEMPTGASAGIGARLLAGSYYGQTIQIWSALFAASLLAAILVWMVGLGGTAVVKRMGMAR
ncbi:NitT/TauT family transport system permease protein [Kaistia hirudinis]|uniref:NitT/TauT family transport system permease protein n=1 Tax=Kaistia hirudinis TaxID=1293440 RepID=A0A840ATA2_9HYPH|nr:ABC transporter permease [Kaistia hirudinis]MBB3933489.1 NitT/TauT family transport system permease protein [Kaistia hirudinis]MBN9020282.1 ABC transporter permease [Hyphomicrobiales bacterium]